MAVEPIRAFGGLFLDGIEERLVIGGPSNAGYAFDALGQRLASAKVLQIKSVLTESRGIDGVRQPMIVVADLERAYTKKRLPFGKGVQIQKQFLPQAIAFCCVRLAANMDGILLALLCTREIEIAAEAVGNGKVGL